MPRFYTSKHKIFPVDGQHRVEGIKAALIEKPELKNQSIAAIFIGHKNDIEGMQRTRRLFTTLNRYAKPVSMDDIIALDEDDSVAIITRELLETFPLFTGNRVTKSKNKAIPDTDKSSITSIITLYQCNLEILKIFRRTRKDKSPNPIRDKKSLITYLKFRPNKEEITLFLEFSSDFWKAFINGFSCVNEFIQDNGDSAALPYRNRENGGNLIFRPVSLLPLVQACIEIHKRTDKPFKEIFERLNLLDFSINEVPWRNVLWNPNEKTMIMGSKALIKLLILFMYGNSVIKTSEKKNLKDKYADKINADAPEEVLSTIPISNVNIK